MSLPLSSSSHGPSSIVTKFGFVVLGFLADHWDRDDRNGEPGLCSSSRRRCAVTCLILGG